MKSFCVFNKLTDNSAYERIGAAAAALFGGKIGIAYDGGNNASLIGSHIAHGVSSVGGFAEIFGCVNESVISFLVHKYRLSAALFVSGRSLVSVYGGDGKPLDSISEEKLSELIASDEIFSSACGTSVDVNCDASYFSALVSAAENLEDACACIVSQNADIRNMLISVINAAGGELASKPKFFLSDSGFCVSAVDERGNILRHENLVDICNLCHLEAGKDLTVPFSASRLLESVAASSGAKLKRSFDAGNQPWQNDGLFLTVEILKNMSLYGMGLCSMSERVKTTDVVRKKLPCDITVDVLVDMIPCDEVITDGRSIYARFDRGQVLLTRSDNQRSYCMEASSADMESAAELAADVAQLLLT